MDELSALLLAAGGGDRAALAEFVRRTQDDVWRFCAHLVDPAAADDLSQEVYLRALRAAPRFRGDAPARAWLLTIARRAAADEIRGRQRRRRLPSEVAAPAAPDPTGELALRDLIDGLEDPAQREAFVLTQLVGLRYAEAAEVCGVPIGTIRSRVARARQRLLGQLAELGLGPDDEDTLPTTADEDTLPTTARDREDGRPCAR